MYDGLISLYDKYGYYKEKLETRTLSGIEGMEKIQAIMTYFRTAKMDLEVKNILDYKKGIDGLPKSDVLKFILEDGWFAVRPSGTEPKIKLYFGVVDYNENAADKRLTSLVDTVMSIVDNM